MYEDTGATETIGERGCGFRKPGGIYGCTSVSPFGLPVEHFLLCPPVPVDPEALGVSPVGVTLMEVGGVHHIVDWVGSNYWPNVADFVEEVGQLGNSRRLSAMLDYSVLTPASQFLFLHSRAIVENVTELFEKCENGFERLCPADREGHTNDERYDTIYRGEPIDMCAAAWYEVVEHGEKIHPDDIGDKARIVNRTMPSFEYRARCAPADFKPKYALGMFMKLPLTHIEIVFDAEQGTHEDGYKAASSARVPVRIVEE